MKLKLNFLSQNFILVFNLLNLTKIEYLGKGKKEDLRVLCDKLDLTTHEEMKMVELRNLISTYAYYGEENTKNLLQQ